MSQERQELLHNLQMDSVSDELPHEFVTADAERKLCMTSKGRIAVDKSRLMLAEYLLEHCGHCLLSACAYARHSGPFRAKLYRNLRSAVDLQIIPTLESIWIDHVPKKDPIIGVPKKGTSSDLYCQWTLSLNLE